MPSLSGGGGEKVFVNLANELAEKGLIVELVIFHSGGILEPLLSGKVSKVVLNTRLKKSLFPIMSYMKGNKGAVIFTGPQYLNFMAIAANRLTGRKCSIIATHHNFPDSELKALGIVGKYAGSLMKWLYPKAERVVAVSDGLRQYLVESIRLSPEKVKRIYNPVVNELLYSLAKAEAGHPWLERTADVRVIIAIGRMVSVKNFELLIQAFAVLAQEDASLRMIIIGDGPERDNLLHSTRNTGFEDRVDFPGEKTNPYAYLSRSAVMVSSSDSETFSITTVEAMALGIPVVATATAGVKEVLENGKYGRMVPVRTTPEILAEAIRIELQQPREMRPVQERANEFSCARIAREYVNTALQVLPNFKSS
ncbi:glycosyltransferase [Chitinophaga dinghuensis]|nr:glycosyltransferase [Chitinophaga dinghuensis]